MTGRPQSDGNRRPDDEKPERPDPKVAARKPQGGEDRPGFDLGGSSEENRKEGPKDTIPGGPRRGPAPGSAGGGSR